ncbi:MAG: DUF2806 domain-containing protein [Verrucomicrobia bacterium]|nr:DUF2806 domain-containing protein [Verrucomicrobiota bacterium]
MFDQGTTAEVSKAVRSVAEVAKLIIGPVSTVAQTFADGHRLRTIAKAEIDAEQLKERARKRTEFEAIRHQINLETTLARAQQMLAEQEQRKILPESFGKAKIDEDWLFKWSRFTQDVSDVDVQGLWAKLLAGELVDPGRYSLKLLHSISVLRKSDANAFALFANYVWEGYGRNLFQIYNHATEALLERNRGMNYQFYSSLQSLGFIDANQFLKFRIPAGKFLSAYYSGNTYTFPASGSQEIIHVRMLTDAGNELFSLCSPEPDSEYLDAFFDNANFGKSKKPGKSIDSNSTFTLDSSVPPNQARWQ